MDEAGTSGSPTDPVAVIVGVIVHEKTQWVHARNLVRRVRFLVPAPFRSEFIFHATDIWRSCPAEWCTSREFQSVRLVLS